MTEIEKLDRIIGHTIRSASEGQTGWPVEEEGREEDVGLTEDRRSRLSGTQTSGLPSRDTLNAFFFLR